MYKNSLSQYKNFATSKYYIKQNRYLFFFLYFNPLPVFMCTKK